MLVYASGSFCVGICVRFFCFAIINVDFYAKRKKFEGSIVYSDVTFFSLSKCVYSPYEFVFVVVYASGFFYFVIFYVDFYAKRKKFEGSIVYSDVNFFSFITSK